MEQNAVSQAFINWVETIWKNKHKVSPAWLDH